MDVTVAVCTFGGDEWIRLAQRARASAALQGPVIHVHGDTLADARNTALRDTSSEWIVYLDADDELEPGYLDALAAGTADVRAPAVRYITDRRAHDPYVPRVAGHRHACTAACLVHGNWLVIGSAMRTELARAAGGWHDWPVYEDWDLFLRLHLRGATFEAIPSAIYRANVRQDSRNRAPSAEEKDRIHREIVAANAVSVSA